MPPPFPEVTLEEFAELLRRANVRRRINAVHMHHTWRPDRAQYRGHDTILGMWRHHTRVNHWSDIAQHITIAPDGMIWLGRNWDQAPASASGHNGNSAAGPFMFEMIGDFDREPFDGRQREVALEVIARVQRRWELPPEALHFHNQMSSKSCPGNPIDYAATVAAVRQVHERLAQEEGAGGRKEGKRRALPDGAYPALGDWLGRFASPAPPSTDPPDAEPEETEAETLSEMTMRSGARDGEISDAGITALRPHFVNLRQGRFSDEGRATTAKGDVDAIFDEHLSAALKAARDRQDRLRILFFAHGGLVSQNRALSIANLQAAWWRANNVYPIFFIWETGLMETIGQLLSRSRQLVRERGIRDIWDFTTDPTIETLVRTLCGSRIWSGMKRSAERASDGQGGARYVAERLADFCEKAGGEAELHAVGHSAGAIFHSHFLPCCLAAGTPAFRTVSLLAPAIRVDGFKERLAPLLGQGVDHLGLFTMRKDLELADHCSQIYRKSLLYLIHYALEAETRAPILGLEASLRADAELRGVFGLAGRPSKTADVVWSASGTAEGPSASRSTSHGGFDNDAPTMNSVLRRVLDRRDGSIVAFPREALERGGAEWDEAIDWPDELEPSPGYRPDGHAPVFQPAPAGTGNGFIHDGAGPGSGNGHAPPAGGNGHAPWQGGNGGGRRQALCIGIDEYPTAPLYGCVADARLWARTLQALGFETPTLLLNGEATRQGILRALNRLVEESRPGDSLVFQYSGHGTQLPDLGHDEQGGDSPGQDEALCSFDFASGAFVMDDDIGVVLDRLPDGVSMTCLIDCCHSGTISRFGVGPGPTGSRAANERARFLPATPDMISAHRRYRTDRKQGSRHASPRGRDAMREVVFSACLSTEVAYETSGQGDFTLRAVRLLAGGGAGMTNEGFQQQITASFGTNPRQHPGLYGPEHLRRAPLFGAGAGIGAGRSAQPRARTGGMASERLREALSVIEALGL